LSTHRNSWLSRRVRYNRPMDDKKRGAPRPASLAMPRSWRRPRPDGADLELVSFPTFLMQRALTLYLRNSMRPELALHDLGAAEYRVLAFLDHFGEVTSAEVQQGSSMDKGQISRAVDALVARGMVQRKSDPSHGRRYPLRITKPGKKAFDRAMVSVRRLQADILALLSQSERQGLYSALAKLVVQGQSDGIEGAAD
jgi:DNA-binding MarR family transcriptional regulator